MSGATPYITTTTTVGSASAAISLMEVANWDGKSQEIHKALASVFDAMDYLECIKNLRARQIEPRLYINNLDKVSSHPTPKYLTQFIAIGDRSSTPFRPTQTFGEDAYER